MARSEPMCPWQALHKDKMSKAGSGEGRKVRKGTREVD